MMLSLLVSVAAAGPASSELSGHWTSFVREASGVAALALPAFSEKEWGLVAEGGVVKHRIRGELGVSGATVDRVVGLAFVPFPVEQVWIGVLDDVHASLVEGLTERQLPGTTPRRKVLYQALDLPFPFHDRHWVLQIESNAALLASTGAWERTWSLDPRGTAALVDVDPAVRLPVDDAVWTPENDGGWLMVPVPGQGTLVVYQARTDIGGVIPDDLVTRYALARLDEMVEQTTELAERAPRHYVGDHDVIYGPGADPVPVW